MSRNRSRRSQRIGKRELLIFVAGGACVGSIAGASVMATSPFALVLYGVLFGLGIGAFLGLTAAGVGFLLVRVGVPTPVGVTLGASLGWLAILIPLIADVEPGTVAMAVISSLSAGLLACAIDQRQEFVESNVAATVGDGLLHECAEFQPQHHRLPSRWHEGEMPRTRFVSNVPSAPWRRDSSGSQRHA